jgi:heptaprenyl diphosphate synthase
VNPEFLDSELAAVRTIIAREAQMTDPRAGEAIGDLVGAGGKLLRPRILILSALTGNYEPERVRPLAAAVELLHTATLVHDDVIDDSPSRRGLPAVHARIGRKNAVLSGDFLLSRCFLLASASASGDNAKTLAAAIGAIVAAEIEQGSGRWAFSPSIRSCIRKISGKTAVLFSLSARAGAVASGAPPATVAALTRAGWGAGVAFQIQDDILDWRGNESDLGKAVLNDLKEGLCTLPLAFALESEGARLAPLLDPRAVAAGSAQEVAVIVEASGGIDRAANLADTYLKRSLTDLDKIPDSFARETLRTIFSSFVGRSR